MRIESDAEKIVQPALQAVRIVSRRRRQEYRAPPLSAASSRSLRGEEASAAGAKNRFAIIGQGSADLETPRRKFGR